MRRTCPYFEKIDLKLLLMPIITVFEGEGGAGEVPNFWTVVQNRLKFEVINCFSSMLLKWVFISLMACRALKDFLIQWFTCGDYWSLLSKIMPSTLIEGFEIISISLSLKSIGTESSFRLNFFWWSLSVIFLSHWTTEMISVSQRST
jgi:hypothetical protein